MIILIASFVLIFVFYPFFRFPKLLNDGLYCLVGKKRTGKTTFLAATSIYYYLRNRPVYSTCALPCAKLISKDDIGVCHFPQYSVILIDEIGLLFNNRNFKTFPEHVLQYFKLQGHYKHLVIVASQAFDFDKKIRDLVDRVGLIDKYRFDFTRIRWVNRKLVLTEPHGDEPSSICEQFVFDFPLFGGWYFVYRPLYYPFFDSFEAPELNNNKKFKTPKGMKFKFNRRKFPPLLAFWTYRFRLTKFFKLIMSHKLTEKPQNEPVTDVPLLDDGLSAEDNKNTPMGENKPFRLNSLSETDRSK